MKIATRILSAVLLTTSIASAQALVTVNGKEISQKDVETALMNATQGRFNQVPPEKQAEFRKQVLEQLIGRELVYQDSKKTGIIKSKEFKQEYKKVQEILKKDIAIQIWKKKLAEKIKIADKDLKKYYDENKEEFREKESVHARHILLKAQDEADAIVKDLKSLKGDALKSKFIELAKAKSTGPSGPKGGDLGYFAQGQMVPEFNSKVFSMKVGTVSKPVKTQFGYHVIYLEDKREAKKLSFKEVKSFIEQRLKMEKFKVTMKSTMEKLQKKAVIK
ncbi:peptidylprolyl isomerase [Sulfurimonas sp.]